MRILSWLLLLIIIALFIWGVYWLAKHGSYFLWYESLVKETVKEMVKPEYLQ